MNVASLFTTTGNSSDTRVSFQSALGSSTPAGNYAINVTQPATHGTLTGTTAAPLTITAGVNDSLSLTIDGQATTVTLAAGTYATADALAAQIQAAVNGSASMLPRPAPASTCLAKRRHPQPGLEQLRSQLQRHRAWAAARRRLFGTAPAQRDGARTSPAPSMASPPPATARP